MKIPVMQSVVYQEGAFFVAQCLNVDVSSFGETEQEALLNLQEALELYFEDASMVPAAVHQPSIHAFRIQNA